MFNLEQAIADWRSQLLAAGIRAKPSLNELENHLREQIAQQTKSGAGDERAFELAIETMGPVNSLAREFKKVAAVKHVQRRKRMCFASSVIVGLYAAGITARLFAFDLTNQQRWLCFAALMTMLSHFSFAFGDSCRATPPSFAAKSRNPPSASWGEFQARCGLSSLCG